MKNYTKRKMEKLFAAMLFGFVALGVVTSVVAVTVTLGGKDYEVSTLIGSYHFKAAELRSTPWWGSVDNAESAAAQVGDRLGDNVYEPSRNKGPYFLVNMSTFDSDTGLAIVFFDDDSLDDGVGVTFADIGRGYTYAIATESNAPDGGSSIPDGGVTFTYLALALLGIVAICKRFL